MTLFEFNDLVMNRELSDDAVLARWKIICNILMDMDVDCVKQLIEEGGLEGLVDFEADDGFGTEGMRL